MTKGFVEKALEEDKQEKKGVYIPPEKRLPRRPEYLKMSKAQVQEAERARKEEEAKVAEYRASLKKQKPDVPKEEVAETSKVKEAAKKGRPKKA